MPYIPQINVDGVVYKVKDAELRDLIGRNNMVDGVNFTEGYSIEDDGTIVSNPYDYAYSDLIPVVNDTYTLYWTLARLSVIVSVHGYDENGEWVRELMKHTTNDAGNYADSFLTAGCKSIRISTRPTAVENLYLTLAGTLASKVGDLTGELSDNLTDSVRFFAQMTDIFDVSTMPLYENYRVVNDDYGRDITGADGYTATDLIPISPGQYLRLGKSLNSYRHYVNFYDKGKRVIASTSQYDAMSIFTAPEGAAYVRFSTDSNNLHDCYICSRLTDDVVLAQHKIMLDTFGHNDGVGIYSNGKAYDQEETTADFAVSGFLPVKPGGKINYPCNLSSATWCFAFYAQDVTFIEAYYLDNNTANSLIDVPANAAFVRFTAPKNKIGEMFYLYFAPGEQIDRISITDFGAVGDKITDNTVAIQTALNVGGKSGIPVYIPSGNFLVEGTLTVYYQNTRIVGDLWGEYASSRIIVKAYEQEVQGDTIVYPTTNGLQNEVANPPECVLQVNRAGFAMRDVIMVPNYSNSMNSDTNHLAVDGIHFILNATDTANVDSNVTHCIFGGFNNCIQVKGRNLKIQDCMFSHSNCGVNMIWDQRNSYEQRGVIVANNRFHSMCRNNYDLDVVYDRSRACIKWPEYANPDSLRASVIRDNYADYCGDFFSGDAHGIEIKNNTLYLCRGALVNSEAETVVVGEGTVMTGQDLFVGGLPSTQSSINVFTLQEIERSGIYLTPFIPVTPGGAFAVNFNIATNVWGHGLYHREGNEYVIVDAVSALNKGLFVIPENVTHIRFTVAASDVCHMEVTLYDSYSTGTDGDAAVESYADQQIMISGNTVCGAIVTDYSPGLNVMENAIKMKGYACVTIRDNTFENGISDVINLDKCRKVTIDGNHMMSAPRYCEVYDADNELTVYEATGKNYIKMTNSENIVIRNNLAVAGKKYNGDEEAYVTVAVTMDGDPVDVSAKNDFEVAE